MLEMAGRMGVLGTETAFEVLARANALAAQGRSIINLGIGQTDLPTPRHIVEAGRKALADGHHGYTPANGIPSLRAAVAADLWRRHKVEVSTDQVLVVPGGKVTMFFVIMMFGEPGVEILYPNPGFPIYESVIKFSGATSAPVPLHESKGFSFSAEEVLEKIRPKALFPHAERLAINCHSCVNAATQWAGIAALEGPREPVERMVKAFTERREVIVAALNSLPGVRCVQPGGAFYAFPNISGTGYSARDLQSELLDKAGVATIAGTSFGAFGEDYLRFSYASSVEAISEAIERIRQLLGNLPRKN